MRRPEAHETDTRAQQLLESAFPAAWVVRRQHPDYGADYEVEVFEDGASTGLLFKVQLKGTRSPALSHDGTFVSCEIRTDRLAYLVDELRAPTVLAVVDVGAEVVYWVAPQLDAELCQRVQQAGADGQDSVTVRVPAPNQLPDTINELLRAIGDAQILLGTRVVQESSIPHFAQVAGQHFNSKDLIRGLTTKATVLKLQQIRTAYRANRLQQARALLGEVLNASDADPGVRVAALAEGEKQEYRRLKFPPNTFHEMAQIKLLATFQMRSVAANGPFGLRLYASIAFRAAELELLTCHDLGMYQNWVANEAGGDPFWRLSLAYARRRNADKLLRKYRQCARLINWALHRRVLGIIPDCAERMIAAIALLINRLDSEGLSQQAESHRRAIFNLGSIGIEIAVQAERWDEVAVLVGDTRLAVSRKDETSIDEMAEWAEEQLRRIADDDQRQEWIDLMHRQVTDLKAALRPDGPRTPDENSALDRQIYQNMAISLGINLDDPEDDVAGIVRLGIADINPERVLKPCRHLFVKLGSHGVVGEWLRLPTAGWKTLLCTLHGDGMGALSLDACLEGMVGGPCAGCSDKSPHDEEWRWTPEWQQEQNRVHGHLAEDSQE